MTEPIWPVVSVVMINYNHRSLIEECMSGIFDQDFTES